MAKANDTGAGIDSGGPEVTLAERIRADSQNLTQLTAINDLGPLVPGTESDASELSAVLARMAHDERFKDVCSVVASTGAVYYYSETYITKSYAVLLARAQADDPCTVIAATVREESRTYPRPTNLELFKEQVFNIDSEELETHVARIQERSEFEDIKSIHASTGARYLYSDRHMTEDLARSLVEWVEVEEEENP